MIQVMIIIFLDELSKNSGLMQRNGNMFASSAETNLAINFWTFEGKLVRTLKGHKAPIKDFAFSGDGRYLISGSKDGNVRFWNVADGRLLKAYELEEEVRSVRLSYDGSRAFVSVEGRPIYIINN